MLKKNLMEYEEECGEMKDVLKEWRHKLNPMKRCYNVIGIDLETLIEASKIYVAKTPGRDAQDHDDGKMKKWRYIGIDGEDLMDKSREQLTMPHNKLMDKIWKQTEQKEEQSIDVAVFRKC